MTLWNHVGKVLEKLWIAFHTRPLSPLGPERIVGGKLMDVVVSLELALLYRDLGSGAWSTWKCEPSGITSYALFFKYRPQSMRDETVILATLPFTLQFVLNQSESTTALSWAFSSDDPTCKVDPSIIEATEKIIASLLTS